MEKSKTSDGERQLPLWDGRVYRYKNPRLEFFCPLCRSPRAFSSTYRLDPFHYIQILFIGLFLAGVSYPFIGAKGIFFIFPVWLCFELFVRGRFREKIPCPYCGFDASWYQRDVKISRDKVRDFWDKSQGFRNDQR